MVNGVSNFTLLCDVSANPPIDKSLVKWYFKLNPLPSDAIENMDRLEFDVVYERHAGTYMCSVVNPLKQWQTDSTSRMTFPIQLVVTGWYIFICIYITIFDTQ